MNVFVYLGALAWTTCYAMWKGGGPERLAALLILVAVMSSAVVLPLGKLPFSSPEIGLALVDSGLAIGLVALALFANRQWPIFLASLAIMSVMLELANWVAPHDQRQVYKLLHASLSYPKLALIFVGVLRHRARLTRTGIDHSWLQFSRISIR